MPETMIIYRFFFEWLGREEGISKAKGKIGYDLKNMSVQSWWKCYNECKSSISSEEWELVDTYIHTNNFDAEYPVKKQIVEDLLYFYQNNRKSIIEDGTDLFKMKKEYDKNPTVTLTRHGKKQNL